MWKGVCVMQKITPFLWFDNQAEEAMNFYVSVFKNAKVKEVSRFEGTAPEGNPNLLVGTIELEGLEITLMNAGPMFKLTEAFSLVVNCETQEEVDYYWEKLSAGGEIQQCGWLKDQFGVSWQIVPTALPRLVSDPDKAKASRVMEAMMQMVKLDVAKLEAAARG